ncbi:MAG: glycoside hydrolase family 25 [Lachnospiraceae bacterium]|nr:glycoside hydrolase family 25 [Lachnospiraceae bacterium]
MTAKKFIICVLIGLTVAFLIVFFSTIKLNSNEDDLANNQSNITEENASDDDALDATTEEQTTEEATEITTKEATTEGTTEEDTTAPILTYLSQYPNVAKGSNFDIHEHIGYADDLDSSPIIKVKGKVNTRKTGSYPIKVIIKDHAGNKLKQSLTINVYKPASSSSTSSSYTPNWYKFKKFKKKYKNKNTMLGIDVSRWQNEIDFEKVAKDGVKFVIMRIGGYDDGELYNDKYYAANMRNAKAAGLKVGIYYHAEESSIAEVKEHVPWIMEQLNGEELDFPIAYDWEDFANFEDYNMSLKDFNETYIAFDEEVRKYGYEAMLYSSKNYLLSVWNIRNDYPVWLAHYTEQTDYPGDYFIWQKDCTGKVAGIETYVDLDVLYKDRYEFKKYPIKD